MNRDNPYRLTETVILILMLLTAIMFGVVFDAASELQKQRAPINGPGPSPR